MRAIAPTGESPPFRAGEYIKAYQFEGYSDDTFAETTTRTDRDNCADGTPTQFDLRMPDGSGLRITGCYGTAAQGVRLGSGCWMIGVESLDEDQPVDWKITHEPCCGGYQGRLTVDAPDEAVLTMRSARPQ